jgi:hypothetical protein
LCRARRPSWYFAKAFEPLQAFEPESGSSTRVISACRLVLFSRVEAVGSPIMKSGHSSSASEGGVCESVYLVASAMELRHTGSGVFAFCRMWSEVRLSLGYFASLMKKKKDLIAYRGLGRAVGPLLAARALPLRCAASTMLSSTLLASYLTRVLAVVICGSGSTCVSVLSS